MRINGIFFNVVQDSQQTSAKVTHSLAATGQPQKQHNPKKSGSKDIVSIYAYARVYIL